VLKETTKKQLRGGVIDNHNQLQAPANPKPVMGRRILLKKFSKLSLALTISPVFAALLNHAIGHSLGSQNLPHFLSTNLNPLYLV
jgi:hypothetical protein